MARKRTNPFNVVLGLVGVLFTITAMSYCVFVLRGVQSAASNAEAPPAAFEQLMDRYGTAILVGQLAVLAVATVGAVAFDNAEGRRELGRRQATARPRSDHSPPSSPPSGDTEAQENQLS